MLRKNVARMIAVGTLSFCLMTPSGLAFATEKSQSNTDHNPRHENAPLHEPQDSLLLSGHSSSSPSTLDLDSLMEDKLATQAAAETEAATEPSPEEIRQQSISALVETAKNLQGVPYWYGGTTPNGFDCSGFTQYVFSQAAGYELPRTAAEQSLCGTPVGFDELMAGDMVFWSSGSGVYHAGIYVGDWSYIHADCSVGITIASMDSFTPSFAMRII